MKKYFLLIILTSLLEAFFTQPIYGQVKQASYINKIELPKVVTRSYGIALGASQGKYSTFEAGLEFYQGQIKLTKPRTMAGSALVIINPFHNIAGIKSHLWTRSGRFGPTLGISGEYYSDFASKSRCAVGPAIGYRMFGIHLILGYNILWGDKTMEGVNSYYGTLRFYIPLKNNLEVKK